MKLKNKITFLLGAAFLCSLNTSAQKTTTDKALIEDPSFSSMLRSLTADLDLNKDFDVGEDGIEQLSFAVVDLNGKKPVLGSVNSTNFIYPASVYKMYVAAEVLHQISEEKYFLTSPVIVHSPNDVDKSRELDWDPRPLIKNGDTVSVAYLLDLMITRSDNSAANCLIDLAQRKNINAMLHSYGWEGSEVTRKFLSRKFEDSDYVAVRGTETCALHAADFMYKIETNQLVNPWVSMQMKSLLGRQLDTTKLSTGLPNNAMFYHKTGWYAYWTNDVGIVDDGKIRYIISCFLPIEEDFARPKLRQLSAKVYDYFKKKYSK